MSIIYQIKLKRFLLTLEEAGNYLNNLVEDASNEVFEISKNIASQIGTKTAVIYAGSDLTYLVAQRWKTQINENSKSKAYVGFMPEVHHNEILSWEADQDGSKNNFILILLRGDCLLYTSPSPRDRSVSRMPSSA